MNKKPLKKEAECSIRFNLKNIKLLLVAMALLLVVGLNMISATQLGMNYYHESMMSGYSNTHYIQKTLDEASKDFDNILKVTKYIKFYMNPYSDDNVEWVKQLTDLAKKKGMYVVVVINVDDRQLTPSNWQEYSDKVVNIATMFSNKSDEFIVGNEISLHTTMQRSELRQYIEPLITKTQPLFNGPVSYEMFWYEKDDWKGYQGKLYFNLYETFDKFSVNSQELKKDFRGGIVGEFGEDYHDEDKLMNETWQTQEIQKRWDAINGTEVAVAYLFSYREPSEDGFGILRPDGTMKQFLNNFLNSLKPTTSLQTMIAQPQTVMKTASLVNNTPQQNVVIKSETTSNPQQSNSLSLVKYTINVDGQYQLENDTNDGSCRDISFLTDKGELIIKLCLKPDSIEAYRHKYPEGLNFKMDFTKDYLDSLKGFAKI